MVAYNNILVIQTAFIGDAILASSLLEKLHSRFPNTQISILVRKGNEGIYEGHPFLKEVLVWNKKENKNKHLFELLKKIRHSKFDCVINCHRFASSGLLTAFSGAQHTAGYKQNPWSFMFNFTVKHTLSEGKHETERYNQLIADFTDNEVFAPKLYPGENEIRKINSLQTNKYICLAPASVWFTKQMPKQKWIDLCNRIPASTAVYLLGAASDGELCEEIKVKCQHLNVKNLAGELSLLESAALMKNAEMNFVNDSAPLHLCSAVNAPVTAFFCSTIPEFGFGPIGTRAQVIEVKGLSCKPCGVHGYKSCPKGHFKCGFDIELPTIN